MGRESADQQLGSGRGESQRLDIPGKYHP